MPIQGQGLRQVVFFSCISPFKSTFNSARMLLRQENQLMLLV
jgi:hypothetical protein